MKNGLNLLLPNAKNFKEVCDYIEKNIVSPNLSINGGTLNYKDLTYGSDVLLVYIVDNKIVGYNSLVFNGNQLYIYQIGIIDEHKNKGIGTAMMKKAIEIAEKYNLIVTAHVKDYNKASQKMFENLNFYINPIYSKPDNYFYVRNQHKLTEEKTK